MESIIEKAWLNRDLLKEKETQHKIREVIENLDKGKVRVAEKKGEKWITHEWVKKSVILYFAIQKMETTKAGPSRISDKIDLKNNYSERNIRVVPHAVADMDHIFQGCYFDAKFCKYRCIC